MTLVSKFPDFRKLRSVTSVQKNRIMYSFRKIPIPIHFRKFNGSEWHLYMKFIFDILVYCNSFSGVEVQFFKHFTMLNKPQRIQIDSHKL